jgi:hypothetical protein
MSDKLRKFMPEVEKVWHKDYQCDYYRGIVVDADDNIACRCSRLHPDYDSAMRDAEKKIALSPLYSKQTTPEMQAKCEEYKRKKAEEDKRNAVVIFDPKEWNRWQYIYDKGMYRFRYMNQNSATSTWIATKSTGVIGPLISSYVERKGAEERDFYLSRVTSEIDLEKLPGHKEIWRIDEVLSITSKRNGDSKVKIRYVEYGNLREDFKKHEKTKVITIKRKWPFYNELMEYLAHL